MPPDHAPAAPDTIRVTDDRGRTLVFSGPRRRIVSLVPAATEILYAIGAGDRVVGRTRFDERPEAVKAVPSVGDGIRPSIELVADRRPDLVVLVSGTDNAGVAAALERAGVSTLAIEHNTLTDLEENIRRLGAVTACSVEATALISRIRSGLRRVASLAGRRSPRPVYYDVWADPPITVGRGSYLDSLITVAGGKNVFGDLADPSPQVSLESIAVRRPELVLWPAGAAPRSSHPTDRPGWQAVEAVARGRVRRVEPDLMHRLGPRIVEAAVRLAEAIHPNLAANVDPSADPTEPRGRAEQSERCRSP